MSGQLWDAPNQQVVREDRSTPWDEGSGAGGDKRRGRRKGEDDEPDKTKTEDDEPDKVKTKGE